MIRNDRKPLIGVEDALGLVLCTGNRIHAIRDPLFFGKILLETVAADRPHPPFDRVAMDGIAVRAADLRDDAVFEDAGFASAGSPVATLPERSMACLRVATGAILPEGADTVIPVEMLQRTEAGRLRCTATVTRGANIHTRGSDLPEGAPILATGMRIGPAEAGALATFGIIAPSVARTPTITLLCTGDELVEPANRPLPHQIRASHPASLRTTLHAAGFHSPRATLVGDDETALLAQLEAARHNDLTLCTGGVSAGERDFVSDALEHAGFRPIFHGIAMKPGKPLWFGVHPSGCTAFGLPGNPVSALVALVRFVLPHLRARCGAATPDPFLRLPLVTPLREDARTRFLPATIEDHPTGARLRLARSGGSGDLPSLVGSDGFVQIPPGPVPECAEFRPWC